MPDQSLLDPILNLWPILLLLAILKVITKLVSSPSFKGKLGERMVIHAGLEKLDPAKYRHFNDLYLPRPDGKGTTQIDHVVVSPFGIFVIETKNYKGWIFGDEKQAQWSQVNFSKKNRFQNPLRQNHCHIQTLVTFLGIPKDCFHSVVFFIGEAEFKTQMPDNVLNRGLIPWITKHTAPLLSQDAWQTAAGHLAELNQITDRKSAAKAHVAALGTRFAG